MDDSGVEVDPETLRRIRERVLQEEQNQLHFNRPPSINNDIEKIIKNEITEVDIETEDA
jgi:hypothetical protein